jgi:hypothetical protein
MVLDSASMSHYNGVVGEGREREMEVPVLNFKAREGDNVREANYRGLVIEFDGERYHVVVDGNRRWNCNDYGNVLWHADRYLGLAD